MNIEPFLNATVGLHHVSVVTNLGFEVEPSPLLIGANLVTNDPSPTTLQWVAVGVMTMAILVTFSGGVGSEDFLQQQQQQLVWIWRASLVSSWFHNIDNILRPGTYFTPTWIVEPKLLFPMDQGFLLWSLAWITGLWSIKTTANNQIPILIHCISTSFGIMHYVAQSLFRFSFVAHLSILFEVVMGIIVGVKLIEWQTARKRQEQSIHRGRYEQISAEGEERANKIEMSTITTAPTGLRQRSQSPKVWK